MSVNSSIVGNVCQTETRLDTQDVWRQACPNKEAGCDTVHSSCYPALHWRCWSAKGSRMVIFSPLNKKQACQLIKRALLSVSVFLKMLNCIKHKKNINKLVESFLLLSPLVSILAVCKQAWCIAPPIDCVQIYFRTQCSKFDQRGQFQKKKKMSFTI